MALNILDYPGRELKAAERDGWRGIPAAVISDELNRLGTMDAGIKPLSDNWTIIGPAFTVHTIAADNLALHHAVSRAPRGVVLVIDAGGYNRNAVWGGILHRAAELRGIAGVVIDGCVRDASELRKSPVSCFARGVVPAGPHKGWGGMINGPVQVGGCCVQPGDIVIGDADGVVIVPADSADAIREKCRARMAAEEEILRKLEEGRTTVEIMGLAAPSG